VKSSIGCFFLDTCILISEILNENNPRIQKLKKDAAFHDVRCYVSDSVEKETEKKVKETTDFLGNAIKDTLCIHLVESRKGRKIPIPDPMTNDDIKALEELFYGFQTAVRKSGIALPNPLSSIEEWVISYLSEKLDEGRKIGIDEFAVDLVKSILKLTGSIQDSYDYLISFEKGFVKKRSVILNPKTVYDVDMLGVHNLDSEHIASAVENQRNSSEKTAFVTLDFSTILSKCDNIRTTLGIECCDPLYALHHLL
jgi:hypothetical protein